jgi:hypothetical protein
MIMFMNIHRAFNPQRAKTQNITVGVSLGATRELAFLRAPSNQKHKHRHNPKEEEEEDGCRIYFPQPNNTVFTFGRDVNIHWKHGINALPKSEQQVDGKGRISIVLWGLVDGVVEEDGSPPLLGSDGTGPHASHPTTKKNHPHHPKRKKHPRSQKQHQQHNSDSTSKKMEKSQQHPTHKQESIPQNNGM